MTEKQSVLIQKTAALSALAAITLQLTFFIITPVIDCKDSCFCSCSNAEAEEIAYSDCCSSLAAGAKTAAIKSGCCDNDKDAHKTHYTSAKNHYAGNIIYYAQTYVLNNNLLDEFSRFYNKEILSAVYIVYFIFKPPIVLV